MASRTGTKRRTPKESAALRLEIARLSDQGLKQRAIAQSVNCSQPVVCKTLKQYRADPDGSMMAWSSIAGVAVEKRREPAARPPRAGSPTGPRSSGASAGIASMAPNDYYAHVVNELEEDIAAAREGNYYNAIAGLRSRQTAAYEHLKTARSEQDDLDGMTAEELVGLVASLIKELPPELRAQAISPGPRVVAVDGESVTG